MKEENLFNMTISNPIVYIFTAGKHHNQYVLTEILSNNPLRVRSLAASPNISDIISAGQKYCKTNGYSFIDNEIYTPF